MSSTSSDDGYNSDYHSSKRAKFNITRDSSVFKKKYLVEDLLNNSANGTLYTGVAIDSGSRVVIKQVPKAKVVNFVNVDGRPVPREFHIHRLASDIKGVVRAHEWFERRTSWVLVMDQPMNSIDIFDFTAQYGTVTEECASIILSNLLSTCNKMFCRGIFHRDIKDENVLLNPSTLQTSVIDFGCAAEAQSREQKFRSFSGTPDFTAPEYYVTGVIDQEKSTVWNVGCLLHILLFGSVPFDTRDDIITGEFQGGEVSQQMKKIIKSIFQVDPAKRIGFNELREALLLL